MMKRVIGSVMALALVLALGIPGAWALGDVDNHNTNSNTATGGVGGTGGDANSSAAAAASAGVENSIHNSNTNVGVNEQSQSVRNSNKQKQSQNNKQVISPSQTVNEGDTPAQAPAIFAPNLTSSPEACMGSVSAGGGAGFGGTSFGITFGTTWTNDQCQDRMNARTLSSLGQNQAALEYLAAANPKIADALKKAGVKTASVDITMPALTLNTPLGTAVPAGGVKVEKRDEVAKADAPFCSDGKPAKLRPSGFYSCYGYDR